MTNCILALALLAPVQTPEGHEQRNPIYQSLRKEGLVLAPEVTHRLPAPLFPDGLAARDQQVLLRKILNEEKDFKQFVRNSPVAPHILRLREVKPAAPDSITRSVEVVFVAHGDLKSIASKKFLESVLDVNRKEGKATTIPTDYLRKRGLKLLDEEHEGFGHLTFNLLEKVLLEATGHSYWSETPDSILAATRIDERFLEEPTYPNRWRSIQKGAKKGPGGKAHPYAGAGYYVKVTRLAQPQGALFVEAHILFKEPQGWFQGTNLLRSKLPPVMQNQVHSFRRQLLRQSEKE